MWRWKAMSLVVRCGPETLADRSVLSSPSRTAMKPAPRCLRLDDPGLMEFHAIVFGPSSRRERRIASDQRLCAIVPSLFGAYGGLRRNDVDETAALFWVLTAAWVVSRRPEDVDFEQLVE